MNISKLTRATLFVLCLYFVFTIALTAQAASFDCAKAQSKVEHIICDDPEISKLDDELAVSYKSAMQDQTKVDAIKQTQKLWLKERNNCAKSECVKRTYANRQSSLRNENVQTNAANTNILKSRAHYVLMMSEDDAVCKPILVEYNRNIELDLWQYPAPHPYPWPVPPALALTWKVKPWKSLAEDERVLEKAYTMTDADLDGDGKNEAVVRYAVWLRSDDRESSLEIYAQDTVLPDHIGPYEQFRFMNSKADVTPGRYDFPKLKGKAFPSELNDFDVIQFNGKQFVTGKTVVMDGIVELHDKPQWRIISRVRYGEPAGPQKGGLNKVLDSVCYFKLKLAK